MYSAQRVFGKFSTIARVTLAASLLLAGLSAASPAQATLLGLVPQANQPDITATFDATTLGGGAGSLNTAPFSFNASSVALVLNPGTGLTFDGIYSLYYNSAGPQALNIFTLSDASIGGSTPLLSGIIVQAGEQYDPSSGIDAFDFLVQLTPVNQAMTDAGFGPVAGIILSPYESNSDIFNVPVPEPGTFLLVAAGLGGLAFLRRRNS